MSSGRPPIFRRNYLVNKPLQLRITLAMVIEVALITASLSLILIHINQYYIGLITYFVGPAEAEQIALSDINKGIWMFLFGGVALSSIVFGLIGVFISHKVAGPLYRLKKAMGYVRNGEYSREIRFRKGDELHDMAVSFNEMSMSLEVRKEVDMLYIEKMEALVQQILSAPADSKVAGLSAKLTGLQQAIADLKENKQFIYSEPLEPWHEKKVHKHLKEQQKQTVSAQ
ncbi:MAG: HAMP domain-containing protein [Candidatus Auribacterota bacterium]